MSLRPAWATESQINLSYGMALSRGRKREGEGEKGERGKKGMRRGKGREGRRGKGGREEERGGKGQRERRRRRRENTNSSEMCAWHMTFVPALRISF